MLPDPRLAGFQARAHRGKIIRRAFLEAQHKIPPHNNADLLDREGLGILEPGALEHDKHVVAIVLDLGPLVRIGDILDHQRVEAESLADPLDRTRIVDPAHVHPGDLAIAPHEALLDRRRGLLVK